MNRIQSVSNVVAGRAATLAAAASAGTGIVQIIHTQRHTSRVVGLAGHLSLGFMMIALLSMWPMYVALARYARGRAPERAALAVSAGLVGLGLTCIYPLVHGSDLGVFPILAAVTNGAWLLGSIVLAVTLKRAGRVPSAVAIALPFVWLTSIIGAGFGGGVLTGAYLVVVGHLLATDTIDRPSSLDLSRAMA